MCRPAAKRGHAERRPGVTSRLTYQSEFRQRILPKHPAVVCVGGRVSGSGRTPVAAPSAGCWSNGLVVVRLVAGIASGVAGSWFGVSGSWSRMRHQRAAAGWSSGRVPRRPPTGRDEWPPSARGERQNWWPRRRRAVSAAIWSQEVFRIGPGRVSRVGWWVGAGSRSASSAGVG